MKRTGARLGQHFLTGLWAAAKLVEAARAGEDDTILEIGPGHGALTRELLKTGARVVAIEKDEALAEELRTTFAHEIATEQFELIEGDVRDFDPASHQLTAQGYILAANIPYYITGEILRRFLTAAAQPARIVVLIQKEVAERILARGGKQSLLSISVQVYGRPSIVAKVARGNFSPPPSVDSAILLVDDISRAAFDGLDEAFFFSMLHAAFASKRKKLLGNLAKVFGKEEATAALARCGIDPGVRAEDVSTRSWLALARELASRVQ
jgi:16S rRNA (adenine1518-N6/adenine1519-N6)-dimethyltransferase